MTPSPAPPRPQRTLEEVLVDLAPVLLRDQHGGWLAVSRSVEPNSIPQTAAEAAAEGRRRAGVSAGIQRRAQGRIGGCSAQLGGPAVLQAFKPPAGMSPGPAHCCCLLRCCRSRNICRPVHAGHRTLQGGVASTAAAAARPPLPTTLRTHLLLATGEQERPSQGAARA